MRTEVFADQEERSGRFRVTVLLGAGQVNYKIGLDKCL